MNSSLSLVALVLLGIGGLLCAGGNSAPSGSATEQGTSSRVRFQQHVETGGTSIDLEVPQENENDVRVKYRAGDIQGEATVSFPGRVLQCVHCLWDRGQGIAIAVKVVEGNDETFYYAVHWFSDPVECEPVRVSAAQGEFDLVGIVNPAGDAIHVLAGGGGDSTRPGLTGWIFSEACPIAPTGGEIRKF
jgi:hypothetical protein